MTDIKIDYKDPVFPISTAAKILNISVHTLRMYERAGLFIASRKKSHQRLFSKADIERIECIRHSINELKISINGIKAIYSLIPCWIIFKCSVEERQNCEAFKGHTNPCWSCYHSNTIQKKQECRECEVYQKYSECENIKMLLKEI